MLCFPEMVCIPAQKPVDVYIQVATDALVDMERAMWGAFGCAALYFFGRGLGGSGSGPHLLVFLLEELRQASSRKPSHVYSPVIFYVFLKHGKLRKYI